MGQFCSLTIGKKELKLLLIFGCGAVLLILAFMLQDNMQIGGNLSTDVLADDGTLNDDIEEDASNNAELWYKQSCSLCHGAELNGNLSNPSLVGIGQKLTVDEVNKIILDGKGDMPGGFLQGVEAQKVAEWIVE